MSISGSVVQARRIGLIGGMSWHSTALYYERLNRAIEARTGRHHSFRGQVCNLDYADLLAAAEAGHWAQVEATLAEAAAQLAAAGCEVIALTAVTAHRWYDAVASAVPGTEVAHVLSATATHLDAFGLGNVAVLGTSLACSSPFLDGYLARGRMVLCPEADDQRALDDLIQNVLTNEGADDQARQRLEIIVQTMHRHGAEAVVLACTELPLLLPLTSPSVPVVDVVALHVDDLCDRIIPELDRPCQIVPSPPSIIC
ncbi:amino acid racemase [Rhodopseudomonas sp. HC1]|nr:amino acid racemase [Rhodopseudomonas infernalis]